MGDTSATEASVTASTPLHASGQEYDLLAYFADFTYLSGDLTLNEAQRLLLSILIDDTKHSLPQQSNSGATSQVFVVESADFFSRKISRLDPFPRLIAVKRRIFKGHAYQVARDWKPLKSLSTELRVLTDSKIRAHPNIVGFLGNCWSYADEARTLILPMIILEATELGDLQIYHDRNPDLTLGRQLQLGLGLTRGVVALHDAGIIHCDIKPKNVLVFAQDDPDCPVVPKLIDFDLAILYQDMPERVLPPQGTRAWNSPEQTINRIPLEKDNLFRIDIFSLGMVLMNLLTSNFLSKFISQLENPILSHATGGLDVEKIKRSGGLAMNALTFLKEYANISGPESNDSFREVWMRAAKLLTRALDGDIQHRAGSAVEIERELQTILEVITDSKLLDYHNEEVSLSNSRDGKLIAPPASGNEREQIKKLLAIYDATILTFRPSQSMGFSHEEMITQLLDTGITSEIGSLLEGTAQEELPRVPVRELQRSGHNVVKATHNLGTFDAFPYELLSIIMESLKDVYNSLREASARRAEAAFQHSIASIALRITQGPDYDQQLIDDAMKMLRFAAQNDHVNAQCLLGWMENIFRPSMPREPLGLREIEWLKRGVLEGSRIARIQLKKADPEAYAEALHILRTQRRGMGGVQWTIPDLHQFEPIQQCLASIWYHASTGRLEELRDMLSSMRESGVPELDLWVNAPYETDDSPLLLEACRSGHTAVVHLLLEFGADASLRDRSGVGPLHFLSSFEPSDMLPVATALISGGCGLETWSSGAVNSYVVRFAGLDGIYAHADGTPLLWAVAAGSIEAVDVLLSLGADPWSRERQERIDSHHEHHAFSPVLWAAQAHQAELLERLLRDFSPPEIDALLNSHGQTTHGGREHIGPLGFACLHAGGRILARMILHGPKHMEQCKKTIHMLLDMGASPDRVMLTGGSRDPLSALRVACRGGQPYGLQALLCWKNGTLRPRFSEWGKLLIAVAARDERSLFDELRRVDVQHVERRDWVELIARMAGECNNERYVHAVISKHQDVDPSPADYTLAFAMALQSVYPRNARVIYERADKVDACYVSDYKGTSSRFTILGSLINNAKLDPNRIAAVDAFLDITKGRDSVFERVMVEEGEEQGLNALQMSIMYAFNSGHLSTGADVLGLLLKRFNHPTKHLACRHGSMGESLLHMAVSNGNQAALDVLLTEDGIKVDALNSEKLTPFDYCLVRWQDSSRDASKTVQDAIRAGKNTQWVHDQWEEATERMMRFMERKGMSKHGKIACSFKRISSSTIQSIMVSVDGKVKMQEFDATEGVVDTDNPDELAKAIANLAVGKVFYMMKGHMT